MRFNAWLLWHIGYVGLTDIFIVKIYKPAWLKIELGVLG